MCDHLLVLLKSCWSIIFFIDLLTILVTNFLASVITYFLSQLLEGNILCELSNNFHSQKPKKKSIKFLKIWINQKFQIKVCACSDMFDVYSSKLKPLFNCSNILTFSWVGIVFMGTYFLSHALLDITQSVVQFSWTLLSQLINSISRLLQKLLKYFNGTVILLSPFHYHHHFQHFL